MSKISDYKSKKKIRRIEIESADNGFVSKVYHDKQDDLGKGSAIYDDTPEKTLHTSASSLAQHIKKHAQRHLGGM